MKSLEKKEFLLGLQTQLEEKGLTTYFDEVEGKYLRLLVNAPDEAHHDMLGYHIEGRYFYRNRTSGTIANPSRRAGATWYFPGSFTQNEIEEYVNKRFLKDK